MPPTDQIVIGSVSAALCALGLWRYRWFLAETAKGRRLVNWFGEQRAGWVLRALFAAGFVFGVLLAVGVVNPVEWPE